MRTAMIMIESFSILVCIALAYAVMFEIRLNKKSNNVFKCLVLLNMFLLCVDLITWIFYGDSGYNSLIWICCLILFSFGPGCILMFTGFISAYLEDYTQEKMPLWIRKALITIGVSLSTLSFIFAITGTLFTVKDGTYIAKNFALAGQSFIFLGTIANLIYCITIRKMFRSHDSRVLCLYHLFPSIDMLLEAIFYETMAQATLLFVVTTLSLLFIYITVVSKEFNYVKRKNKELNYTSIVDELTNLYNRRGMKQRIGKLDKDEDICVLFADLNGLKYANDNFGHEKGDKLLIDASNILLAEFNINSVFRVSGDEFVVIITKTSKKAFNEVINRLKLRMESLDYPILAVGIGYGKAEKIEEVIKVAEIGMYKDKAAFHKKYPLYKRQ